MKPTIQEMQNWNKRYKLAQNPKGVIDTTDNTEIWTIHPNEAYNLCLTLNEDHEKQEKIKKDINTILFALAVTEDKNWRLGKTEIQAIQNLQNYTNTEIINITQIK